MTADEATAEPTRFDFWVCDNCHRVYRAKTPQTQVKVEQRTERIYGTDQVYRPVEALVICPSCHKQFIQT